MLVHMLPFATVFAEPETNTVQNNTEQSAFAEAKSPHILLADMKTGLVIYSKASGERVFPSGLTTIMTALLVLERCNIEELVTVTDAAVASVSAGDNKLGIIKDEKLTVRQLLYAMLLASSVDATNLLAEKTAGSIDEFVKLMNSRAQELGMTNTNFTNPTGAHDERHYTTAEDMSVLVRLAMQNESFREIVKAESYMIPATEKSPASRKVTNKNHLVSKLLRNDYYYKYATGIKTGYSGIAKSCIAASAEKNGMSLLALVFEAETEDNVAHGFNDCRALFEYVFSNYEVQTIAKKDAVIAQTGIEHTRRDKKLILKAQDKITVLRLKNSANSEITFKDYLPETVSAPVKKDQVIGEREYFANGVSIGRYNLVAEKNYNLDPVTFAVNKIIAFVTSPWLFLAIAVLIFLLIMKERRRRRILRKKRAEARRQRNREIMRKIDI